MTRSFLYCLEFVGAPVGKVGIATDPMHRLASLSIAAPFALRFRRVFRFADHETAALHERHVIHHANSHKERGEWVSVDATLDALLDAIPGQDVTGDYHFEIQSGRRRRVSRTAFSRRKDFRRQVGTGAADAALYQGAEADYDAAVVRARLGDGYGAEDILVMDGIPEAFTWAVVRDLRSKHQLRRTLRLTA